MTSVRLKVRTRLLLWLLGVTLPIFAISLLIVDSVGDRLTESATEELTNLAVVESQHIRGVLAETEVVALALADDIGLMAALEGEGRPANARRPAATFDTIAYQLLDDAAPTASGIAGVRIVGRDSNILGQTAQFNATTAWASVTESAMDSRRPSFGRAFVTSTRNERLELAVPIVTFDGAVVGALLMEAMLAPLVGALPTYEEFGKTTEATLVQRTDNGAVETISIRRFERDSAFESRHAATASIPSVQSLDAVGTQVVHELDYRGVETIAVVTAIDSVNWGLTLKTDRDEALALSHQISEWIQLASLLTIGIILLGWLTFVRPLGRRLLETANASDRVAQGDYLSLIADDSRDEIGDLSRSIDRLATDLKNDIAARERVEEKLRFQANHDALTGLVNRQRATAIVDDLRSDELFSLLFIDLDRFKEVNDTYGHAVGDELLVAIASRLRSMLPEDAILSRWGGDEFLAVLPGVSHGARERIEAAMQDVGNLEVPTAAATHTVRMSIGGATSRRGASTADVVIKADAEMFRNKRTMASTSIIPAEVVRTVENALAEDRLEPFYQPVVRVDEHGAVHLSGVEALVRIRERDGSVLSPAAFLPALGDHPLGRRVDQRVMSRSIGDLASWHHRGIVPTTLRLAVNAGPAIMGEGGLASELAQAVAMHDVNPNLLLVEIPETVQTVDPEVIEALRVEGFGIAIDDVGVQFSNLERMVDIRADVAKLDRRWIPAMATAEVSKAEVLRALVDQCKTLGLDIIAEGIETESQLQMLRDLDVEIFQGFLFARPLSVEDFERTWCRADAASFRGVSP